jgi:hypothetical protein
MKTPLLFVLLISVLTATTYAGNVKHRGSTYKPVAKSEVAFADNYGTYAISTAEGTRFIEVSGENMLGDKLKDGTILKMADASVNELKSINRWQKWLISKQANGFFTIMNLNSGKYITASKGMAPCQAKANPTDAQYWRITKIEDNYYKITNKGNGLAISNSSLSKDSSLTMEAYTNSDGQHWKLNAIKADSYRDDAVVGFFQRNSGSSAFDEGSSIPLYYSLNKGKVLWVTGDTFYNQVDAKGEFGCNLYFPYHNSALLQPADHSWDPEKTKNLISSDGPQIFHPANPKNLFWPGAGIEVGNKIYVHNIEVITGTLNTVNQYLGVITETGTNTIPPVKVVAVPGMTGQTAIVYTVGMVKPRDGFIYAYGIGGYMAASVFVARFAPAAPTKWKFSKQPILLMAITAVPCGGIIPDWNTRFMADQVKAHPNWRINLEIEPETWDVRKVKDSAAYNDFRALFADQSINARMEYVNPDYAQSYLFDIEGESMISQFYYGMKMVRRHFPTAVFPVYSSEEPCFTSALPEILTSYGFKYASLKNPNTCWGGYTSAYGGEIVNWVGPDGTKIITSPRYAIEALQPGSTWQTIASGNSPNILRLVSRQV